MRRCTYLFVAILSIVMGCSKTPPPVQSNADPAEKTSSTASNSQVSASQSDQSSAESIPPDITYTIIAENVVPRMKRSLDVRLNRKVSEDDLRTIAAKLEASDPNKYDRTFIGYYLPGMQVNSGYWATSHFTPQLEIRMLGLTAEQENALKTDVADPSRATIGTWLDDSRFGRGKIVIYMQEGALILECTYKDGSVSTDAIVETPHSSGRRFDYSPDRGNGEYFLINGKGELQQLDKDGVFMTAKKID